MDDEIEYSDIFSGKCFQISKQSKNYNFQVRRFKAPCLNITLLSYNTISDIYIKIKAEIYKEMYSLKQSEIVDDIPPNIYDVFLSNKTEKIMSIPNSTVMTIEEFIEQNPSYFPDNAKTYEIYVVDEKSLQKIISNQNKVSTMSILTRKIKHYTNCGQ
jgi:hypothetical protein